MLNKINWFHATLLTRLSGIIPVYAQTGTGIDVSKMTTSLTAVGTDVITLFGGVAGVIAIIVAGFILLSVFRGAAH